MSPWAVFSITGWTISLHFRMDTSQCRLSDARMKKGALRHCGMSCPTPIAKPQRKPGRECRPVVAAENQRSIRPLRGFWQGVIQARPWNAFPEWPCRKTCRLRLQQIYDERRDTGWLDSSNVAAYIGTEPARMN